MAKEKAPAGGKSGQRQGTSGRASVAPRGRPFKVEDGQVLRRDGSEASASEAAAYRDRLRRESERRKQREREREEAGLPKRPGRKPKKRKKRAPPRGPLRGVDAIPPGQRSDWDSYLAEGHDVCGDDYEEAVAVLAASLLRQGVRTGEVVEVTTTRLEEYGTLVDPRRGTIVTHEAEVKHTVEGVAPLELDGKGREIEVEMQWWQALGLAADILAAYCTEASEGIKRGKTGKRSQQLQSMEIDTMGGPDLPERKEPPKAPGRKRDRWGRFVGSGKPRTTGPKRGADGRFVGKKK